VALFVFAAALSLGASAVLVTRLERLGERLGLTEAMLGLIAALAADAPEISTAVTALVRGQRTVSVGVILGSNAFNLATLLGLAAIVAGGIGFHRRVVVFEGAIAASMAALCAAIVFRVLPAVAGVVVAVAILVPYVLVSGVRRGTLVRVRLPRRWLAWLSGALKEEEQELAEAIRPRRGRPLDAVLAGVAVAVVVGASVVMEHAATTIGTRNGLTSIVIGGVLLAAVTSLPNAVAGIYLAYRGRGAATLSVALNSNTLNVVAGFLLPAAIVGSAHSSPEAVLTLGWYAGLTALTLVLAFAGRGLSRRAGALIVVGYAIFVTTLVMR
jgi:cation:H+ antiporter